MTDFPVTQRHIQPKGPANRLVRIEGETVSLAEICKRIPNIPRASILSRLRAGQRTWAKLGAPIRTHSAQRAA